MPDALRSSGGPYDERTLMKGISPFFFLIILSLTVFQGNGAAQSTILHDFAGGADDGAKPRRSLISDGSALYGTTWYGGDGDGGTLFKLSPDGSGFELLHTFGLDGSDGIWPFGSLLLQGATLYGMTISGGTGNNGVIFKINTDGSGYGLLHTFSGGLDDGSNPSMCSLISDGSFLYGMTQWGGIDNNGVIFRINPDGSGFEVLHRFADGPDDGSLPWGSLLLHDAGLYGMTEHGGNDDVGVIFKLNPDGSGFELLHEFAPGTGGRMPRGSLIASGSALFGMAMLGGDSNKGSIFRINMDGSGYEALHSFAGAPDDGAGPTDSLILQGGILYGMTTAGGASNKGSIFKINIDGSGYELLSSFAGPPEGGSLPYGSLVVHDSKLFGMTQEGGADDCGVVFSLPLVTPPIPALGGWGMIILAVLMALAAMAVIRRGALIPGRTE